MYGNAQGTAALSFKNKKKGKIFELVNYKNKIVTFFDIFEIINYRAMVVAIVATEQSRRPMMRLLQRIKKRNSCSNVILRGYCNTVTKAMYCDGFFNGMSYPPLYPSLQGKLSIKMDYYFHYF